MLTSSTPPPPTVTPLFPEQPHSNSTTNFNPLVPNLTFKTIVHFNPLVPRIAPSQVYTSDMQKDSIRVNWYYSETPPPGDISTFKIEIYYKDNRYPGRNGEHVRDTFYNLAESERSKVTFSYLLIYLEPGTEYNVLIRAVTSAGVGPAARVWQKTVSTGKRQKLYSSIGHHFIIQTAQFVSISEREYHISKHGVNKLSSIINSGIQFFLAYSPQL